MVSFSLLLMVKLSELCGLLVIESSFYLAVNM